ncbi:hypothetical protein HC891_15805 [Candidatus Gracilibacteria bacterium]|nr:hypothetical protein [Candidatus Gracilibacteria bacterium]
MDELARLTSRQRRASAALAQRHRGRCQHWYRALPPWYCRTCALLPGCPHRPRVGLPLLWRWPGSRLDRLGVAAFIGLADESTKRDLAAHLLSPLDHEHDLITTLSIFFAANCNASVAAARLAIHRNTLSYRFDKVASLTGLDPRRFDDAVQIRLALLLRSLT